MRGNYLHMVTSAFNQLQQFKNKYIFRKTAHVATLLQITLTAILLLQNVNAKQL